MSFEKSGRGAHVFIHGFGGYRGLWKAQEEYFGTVGRAIAVDLPGHGASVWKGETLRAMAHGVAQTLDALAIRQGAFVASSFGGLVALELWQIRPDLFRSMTLVGAVPCFTAAERIPAGLSVERIHALGLQLEGDTAAVLDMFFRSLFTRREREDPFYAVVRQCQKRIPVPSKEALHAFLNILASAALRDVLACVRVPVQLVWGDGDYICPEALMAPLKELCPAVRMDVMPGCGHLPFLSSPVEFNKRVKEFTGI